MKKTRRVLDSFLVCLRGGIKPFIQRIRREPKTRSEDFFELCINISGLRLNEVLAKERLVEKQFHKNEPSDHKQLRVYIDSAFAYLDLALSEIKFTKNSAKISYQFGLSASFLRTHNVVVRQIQSGNLIEASVLVRKQLELLARFKELDTHNYENLKNKTPNINVLKSSGISGKMYGVLSRIAHFSDIDITDHLGTSEIKGSDARAIHVFPIYQENAHNLFQDYCILCIYYLSAILNTVPNWDPNLDLKNVELAGNYAANKARDMGFYGIEV